MINQGDFKERPLYCEHVCRNRLKRHGNRLRAIASRQSFHEHAQMDSDASSLENKLQGGLQRLGVSLSQKAVTTLIDYTQLLARWNRTYNLTAVRDTDAMVSRHLLDALAVLPHLHGATAADLGSGAGIPGIVLAVAQPEREWLLVDSNGKKARFLRAAVRELGLVNVKVAQSRVEDLEGQFACITSRAFATLADMLAAGGHLLATDGTWLAMKGRHPASEMADVPGTFRIAAVTPLSVPGVDGERHLVSIVHNG